MIKIVIGIVCISIVLSTLYAIGRIVIVIIDTENKHPTLETVGIAAMLGLLIIGVSSIAVAGLWLLGGAVMHVLGV